MPAPDAATLAAVRAEYERQAGAPNPDAATLAAYLAKVAPSGTETAAALKALARRVGLR